MTVATPTPADLKGKFPFFAGVDDTAMAEFIAEAGRSVDDTWVTGDQANAIMYLACHLMFTLGATSSTGAPPAVQSGGGVVQSESIGDSSVSFGVQSFLKGGGNIDDDFRSTVWGRRYLKLLKLNQPAVGIV